MLFTKPAGKKVHVRRSELARSCRSGRGTLDTGPGLRLSCPERDSPVQGTAARPPHGTSHRCGDTGVASLSPSAQPQGPVALSRSASLRDPDILGRSHMQSACVTCQAHRGGASGTAIPHIHVATRRAVRSLCRVLSSAGERPSVTCGLACPACRPSATLAL